MSERIEIQNKPALISFIVMMAAVYFFVFSGADDWTPSNAIVISQEYDDYNDVLIDIAYSYDHKLYNGTLDQDDIYPSVGLEPRLAPKNAFPIKINPDDPTEILVDLEGPKHISGINWLVQK